VPLVLSLVTIGVWFFGPALLRFYMEWNFPKEARGQLEQMAQFGDLFGALNTFFSACAFIGIMWSLHWQWREMHMTTRLSAISTAIGALPPMIAAEKSAIAVVEEEFGLGNDSIRWAKHSDVLAGIENCLDHIHTNQRKMKLPGFTKDEVETFRVKSVAWRRVLESAKQMANYYRQQEMLLSEMQALIYPGYRDKAPDPERRGVASHELTSALAATQTAHEVLLQPENYAWVIATETALSRIARKRLEGIASRHGYDVAFEVRSIRPEQGGAVAP
jgi:hypothetical protein